MPESRLLVQAHSDHKWFSWSALRLQEGSPRNSDYLPRPMFTCASPPLDSRDHLGSCSPQIAVWILRSPLFFFYHWNNCCLWPTHTLGSLGELIYKMTNISLYVTEAISSPLASFCTHYPKFGTPLILCGPLPSNSVSLLFAIMALLLYEPSLVSHYESLPDPNINSEVIPLPYYSYSLFHSLFVGLSPLCRGSTRCLTTPVHTKEHSKEQNKEGCCHGEASWWAELEWRYLN